MITHRSHPLILLPIGIVMVSAVAIRTIAIMVFGSVVAVIGMVGRQATRIFSNEGN